MRLWILSSIVLLSWWSVSSIRLARAERSWREGTIADRRIRISPDVGPAVLGFFRSRIVVPEWATRSEPLEQEMILTHEEEHIRAHDPQLLTSSLLLLLVVPWNLPLWWAVHRLRLATEVDCDARVLRRGVDPRLYGSLLLDVSGHSSGALTTALSHPAAFLERRIRMITRRSAEGSRIRSVGGLIAAAGLLMVACGIEQPRGLPADAEPSLPSRGGAAATASAGASYEMRTPPRLDAEGPEPPVRTVALPPHPDDMRATTDADTPAITRPRLPVEADAPSGPSAVETPAPPASGPGSEPVFTPFEVRPTLTNRDIMMQQIQRRYPPALRNAGVGGTVLIFVFIDEDGRVRNSRVAESSGYPALDQAAEGLFLEVAEFTPAEDRGERVPVWIQLPVTFEPRR